MLHSAGIWRRCRRRFNSRVDYNRFCVHSILDECHLLFPKNIEVQQQKRCRQRRRRTWRLHLCQIRKPCGFQFWGHLFIQISWYMHFDLHTFTVLHARYGQYPINGQQQCKANTTTNCKRRISITCLMYDFYGDNGNMISFDFGSWYIDGINICVISFLLLCLISI